jgi:hypothetical protein
LGDYNEDGIADAADFTVWRDTLGQTGLMPFSGADGNGNGTIDLGDYDVWMANFGAIYGSVGAAQVEGHASAVPEPAAAFLLVNAVIFQLSLAWGRRRRTLPNPPRRTSRR